MDFSSKDADKNLANNGKSLTKCDDNLEFPLDITHKFTQITETKQNNDQMGLFAHNIALARKFMHFLQSIDKWVYGLPTPTHTPHQQQINQLTSGNGYKNNNEATPIGMEDVNKLAVAFAKELEKE